MNTNRMTVVLGLVALLAAGIGSAPLAYADPGDQSSAEQAVHSVYDVVQTRCTPSKAPAFQSISWKQFSPATFGQGTIHDAEPSLGGDFNAYYNRPGGPQIPPGTIKHGQWFVQLEFC